MGSLPNLAQGFNLNKRYAIPDRDGGSGAPTPIRVLIVEDDYFVGLVVENHLRDAGFEVVGIAGTAEEALKFAADMNPAITIMDIRLAGNRDGIDAAIELFSRFSIRSIFATAHSDLETRRRAEPAQPLGWLTKPYSPEEVASAIKHALGSD